MEGEDATSAQTVRPIKKIVVHRICAGQVILDLSSAVKELVENSLDAGATSVEIALKDYGEEWFQVIDNGCGISPNNFKVLALRHHTSKLREFPDLQSLTTFGFRGEALSSLCALGDLTVETRTKNETTATHLTYDHSGLLTAEKKTARRVGTTVTVKKLFSSLPVRSKEFSRNIRKEYGKLISLLNAYALISKGVRFVCTNMTGRNAKSVVLSTQGRGSLKDNIINLFGMSTFSCLEPVNICLSDDCKVDGFISKPGQGSGRNLGDRQYFFANGRPIDMPKVNKLMNELYKGVNSRQYPIAIMDFIVPGNAYDVNVTPDKRKVFFSDESAILTSLREGIQHIYSSNNMSFYVNKIEEHAKDMKRDGNSSGKNCDLQLDELSSIENDPGFEKVKPAFDENGSSEMVKIGAKGSHVDSVMNRFSLRAHGVPKAPGYANHKADILITEYRRIEKEGLCSTSSADVDTAERKDSSSQSNSVQSSLSKFLTTNKRKHGDTLVSEVPVLRNRTPNSQVEKIITKTPTAFATSSVKYQRVDGRKVLKDDALFIDFKRDEVPNLQEFGNEEETPSPADEASMLAHRKENETAIEGFSFDRQQSQFHEPVSDSLGHSCGQKVCYNLHFSLQEMRMRRLQRISRLQLNNYTSASRKKQQPKKCFTAATLDLSQPENEERKARDLDAATTELDRLFRKDDFKNMEVIGQFNLGFIIGKLDQDLFIVDQHAADEKYNFERLAQSTVFSQQPLLRPLRLELSPEEEIIVSMHMDVIRRNGFLLEEDPDAPSGCHFKLRAVPFSKSITFGEEDLRDLISNLSDDQGDCSIIGSYKMSSSQSVCPSRVRAMLASRACRSSVMIGDPLRRNEMQKIVEHLAGLESPWNCPHGRPTMRHLVDLTTLHVKSNEDEANL